jgi:heme/copper-type cytochrome/quinol oxidase subunit 2
LNRADVIHSFTVPSLGVKIDTVPGRLNQTSLLAERTGTFDIKLNKNKSKYLIELRFIIIQHIRDAHILGVNILVVVKFILDLLV